MTFRFSSAESPFLFLLMETVQGTKQLCILAWNLKSEAIDELALLRFVPIYAFEDPHHIYYTHIIIVHQNEGQELHG
jgi:hypothetical protein